MSVAADTAAPVAPDQVACDECRSKLSIPFGSGVEVEFHPACQKVLWQEWANSRPAQSFIRHLRRQQEWRQRDIDRALAPHGDDRLHLVAKLAVRDEMEHLISGLEKLAATGAWT